MAPFAATNLQLFNQLLAQGYAEDDLTRVRQSYELARLLFTGQFCISRKTQLSHCVGTASILASFDAPPSLVAAGLIHNVYINGDFGDGVYGMSEPKRDLIRRTLGKDIEQAAADFATIKWNGESISNFLSGQGHLTRDVVFLRLADILDHQLDGGVLFNSMFRLKRGGTKAVTPLVIKAAGTIGLPNLAKELKRCKSENDSSQVLEPFYQKFENHRHVVLVPSSYSLKIRLKVKKTITRYWPSGRQGDSTDF